MNFEKNILIALTCCFVSIIFVNNAHSAQSITVPVVDVQPIETNESVMVKQDKCTPIATGYNNGRRGTDFGQIIGGVIGSMIGSSNSERRIGTAVGVIVGGRVGERYNSAPGVIYGNTHCGHSYTNQVHRVIKGYKVTYEYMGRLETITMNYHPGSYITLETSVRVR